MNPQEQCVPVHFLHDSNLPHNFGFLGSTFQQINVFFGFCPVCNGQQAMKRAYAANKISVPPFARRVIHVAFEGRAAERVSSPPVYQIYKLYAFFSVFENLGMTYRRFYAFHLFLIRAWQNPERCAFGFARIAATARRGRIAGDNALSNKLVVFFSKPGIISYHAFCI